MKTQFKNIVAYTHQGKRPYQEDNSAYGPQYLLVSDGVGGLAKGDIASGIVVDTFRAAIEGGDLVGEDISAEIGAVIDRTLQALLDYAHQNEESMGMGATLALLLHSDDQYISVHIGDSRVYHFSNGGEIKWRSTDHSLVQELVTGGIITEEEAATHPRRNVITRVLQAKEDHSTKASITVLENVVEGDMFMVCSDGVTESWSDAALQISAGHHHLTQDFITDIQAFAAANSNDNNTAIIAYVADVDDMDNTIIVASKKPKEDMIALESAAKDDSGVLVLEKSKDSTDKSTTSAASLITSIPENIEEKPIKKSREPKDKPWWKRFLPFLFLFAMIALYFLPNLFKKDKEKPTKETPQPTNIESPKVKKSEQIAPPSRINDEKAPTKAPLENKIFKKDSIKDQKKESGEKIPYNDVKIIEDTITKVQEDTRLWRKILKDTNTISKKQRIKDFIKNYPESKHISDAKKYLK